MRGSGPPNIWTTGVHILAHRMSTAAMRKQYLLCSPAVTRSSKLVFSKVEQLLRTRLFTLLLVLPVSSCEDERIFSSLRRLKKFLCSTMTQRRINSITFLHVLLGLAIFCAMYLCYVFCVWTLYLPCIEFYLQDCAFVTFIY